MTMNKTARRALKGLPASTRTALPAMSQLERMMLADNLRRPLEALPATSGAADKATRLSLAALAEWIETATANELEAEVAE